jgi:hypothetical protein
MRWNLINILLFIFRRSIALFLASVAFSQFLIDLIWWVEFISCVSSMAEAEPIADCTWLPTDYEDRFGSSILEQLCCECFRIWKTTEAFTKCYKVSKEICCWGNIRL